MLRRHVIVYYSHTFVNMISYRSFTLDKYRNNVIFRTHNQSIIEVIWMLCSMYASTRLSTYDTLYHVVQFPSAFPTYSFPFFFLFRQWIFIRMIWLYLTTRYVMYVESLLNSLLICRDSLKTRFLAAFNSLSVHLFSVPFSFVLLAYHKKDCVIYFVCGNKR